MDMLYTNEFWVALAQIIVINIMLSGDNAVVIALASRSLPPAQQKRAIIFGSVGAIVLRIILTFFAVMLLDMPYLKLVGGIALLWIGASMLDSGGDEENIDAHSNLAAAIKTIIIADFIMSLDNVLGVAAAAKGNVVLLVVGLVISSQMILKLMGRFPVIITLGAGLLGWVAGEMLVTDSAVAGWIDSSAAYLHYVVPTVGIFVVIAFGKWLGSRHAPKAHAGA